MIFLLDLLQTSLFNPSLVKVMSSFCLWSLLQHQYRIASHFLLLNPSGFFNQQTDCALVSLYRQTLAIQQPARQATSVFQLRAPRPKLAIPLQASPHRSVIHPALVGAQPIQSILTRKEGSSLFFQNRKILSVLSVKITKLF